MRELQIKINLVDSHIPIWRRFLVTDDFRLDQFHQVIQIAMGWWNAHLHEFTIGGRQFGMLLNDGWDTPSIEDETRFYLKNFPFAIGDNLQYLYDFGDSWLHELTIEAIKEVNKSKLTCLAGEGRCPYEDSGGVGRYQYMLEAQFDANHPDHWTFIGDSRIEDLPDPTFFDLVNTNKELGKFCTWHNKHPRKKSTPWHQI